MPTSPSPLPAVNVGQVHAASQSRWYRALPSHVPLFARQDRAPLQQLLQCVALEAAQVQVPSETRKHPASNAQCLR